MCGALKCVCVAIHAEERLQANLQENKAHICDLVCEVTSISKLLEKERTADEAESEQMKATGV